MSPRFIVALCCVFVASRVACAGEHWPSWRGPTGMGQSDEKKLPLTWGGKAKTNILWKTPLFASDKVKRDQNQSSPIVWGQRVFVTASHWPAGSTDADFPEHHVLCFDAKDGKKLWDVVIPPGPWKLTDLRGGYTAPTPATDGERVYAIFGSSVVAAVDLKGQIVWRKEITPHDFDVCWGASPIVHSARAGVASVLVVCDHLKGKKSSTIYALDGPSGEIRWEKKRPAVDWGHSTPLLASINGKMQLITATHNGPHGLDPANGDTIWSYQHVGQIGDTVTPIVRDGLLYIDSGRGGLGVAIDATGSGDVSKTALKWKVPKVVSGLSSPVLVGDHLYRLHGSDVLTCWKWTTGDEVYKNRLEGVETSVSPIATADGRIYVVSGGKGYVLKAGPTFEILAKNDLGDPSKASPAVAAGRIYVKGGRYLWCIGTK
ncbi:MAG: PQQ-binding-like beta-propeller repeat protein [Planctomycetes bacterium]|nr:PQQ-binding-like beta-propeller repeat protein [Planctomycetota bacterium]